MQHNLMVLRSGEMSGSSGRPGDLPHEDKTPTMQTMTTTVINDATIPRSCGAWLIAETWRFHNKGICKDPRRLRDSGFQNCSTVLEAKAWKVRSLLPPCLLHNQRTRVQGCAAFPIFKMHFQVWKA